MIDGGVRKVARLALAASIAVSAAPAAQYVRAYATDIGRAAANAGILLYTLT